MSMEFVERPQYDVGGRMAVTADHPLVQLLLETVKNGKAAVIGIMPNSSVRVWLRAHGYVVRTHKSGDTFQCWCEAVRDKPHG